MSSYSYGGRENGWGERALKRDGFRRVRTLPDAEAGRVPRCTVEKPQAGLFMRMAVLGRVCDVC